MNFREKLEFSSWLIRSRT